MVPVFWPGQELVSAPDKIGYRSGTSRGDRMTEARAAAEDRSGPSYRTSHHRCRDDKRVRDRVAGCGDSAISCRWTSGFGIAAL